MTFPSLYETLLRDRSDAAPVGNVRASASVIPWRRDAHGEVEVFWVERSLRLRFMGGWWAFPGGTVDRADTAVSVHGLPAGLDPESRHSAVAGGAPAASLDLEDGVAAAAVRELFEETGLLLDETGVTEDANARQQLLAGETTFGDLVSQHGWRPSVHRLVFAGRWRTPPFAPVSFDNRFFLLEAEARPEPCVIPGELSRGAWIRPADALDRWLAGDLVTAPPILHVLKVLDRYGPNTGLVRLRDTREADLGPFRRIEIRPGITLIPLRTPTLPPATHTNAFLLGRERAVLVDPAPHDPAEQDRLVEAIDAAAGHGIRLHALWLTHHHRDHIGAVKALRERFGLPVLAHPASAGPLEAAGIVLDGHLEDGQRVDLGGDPPLTVRVLHTPGHARGHLAFLDERTATVICGDLLSALSTMVIDPPDGDMDAYLASLGVLEALAPTLLLPAHGPPIVAAVETLRKTRQHRLDREEMIVSAWDDGVVATDDLVRRVYPDLDPRIAPVAARQVEAHLIRLRRDGSRLA